MTNKEEKYLRKRLLMDLGIKPHPKLPEEKQARYTIYKIAHACFECRKSYKIVVDYGNPSNDHVCPQCRKPIYYMGRSFKAPSAKDAKQWMKVQKLYEAGFLFFSYGNYPEAEPLPERWQDVDDFIARNPDHPMKVT